MRIVSEVPVKKHLFNGQELPEEPIWYIQGCDTEGNASLAVFGESSPVTPLAGITPGAEVGGSGAAGFIKGTEMEAYRPRGTASDLYAQSISPSGGYMGICCDSDGYCLRNEWLETSGSLMPRPVGDLSETRFFGIVVGDSGYRRGINLGLKGTELCVVSSDKFEFPYGKGLELNAAHYDEAETGRLDHMSGSVGYNRRSDTLMLVQIRGANHTRFRLHIWRGLEGKIGTDIDDLDQLLKSAKAGGRYSYVDYSTDMSGGDSGENDQSWYAGVRVVPCDDGSAWICHHCSFRHLLFAMRSGGVSVAKKLNLGQSDGLGDSWKNAQKHQLSFDQSRIALYVQYARRLLGSSLYYCSTKAAASGGHFSWYYLSSAQNFGQSIAPVGGSAFAMTQTADFNLYNNPLRLKFLDQSDDQLVGGYISGLDFSPAFSGLATGTNRGGVFLGRIKHRVTESTEYAEGLVGGGA